VADDSNGKNYFYLVAVVRHKNRTLEEVLSDKPVLCALMLISF
jgi:hypothetical protein